MNASTNDALADLENLIELAHKPYPKGVTPEEVRFIQSHPLFEAFYAEWERLDPVITWLKSFGSEGEVSHEVRCKNMGQHIDRTRSWEWYRVHAGMPACAECKRYQVTRVQVPSPWRVGVSDTGLTSDES